MKNIQYNNKNNTRKEENSSLTKQNNLTCYLFTNGTLLNVLTKGIVRFSQQSISQYDYDLFHFYKDFFHLTFTPLQTKM